MTNIARMETLLELHPEVGEVTKYKIQKALDISVFTKDGRTAVTVATATRVCTTCA